MSSCIVLQQQNKIFMGADKAVSYNFAGETFRTNNNAEKIFKKDNYIIFCSGNMKIAKQTIEHIKNMKQISVEKIKEYIISIYEKDMFEIFIADCNNDIVITYQLSSYNEFKEIKRISNIDETNILVLGFKTNPIINSISKYAETENGNVVNIILKSFNDNICEEIGGGLDLFYYKENKINSKNIKLEDNIIPINYRIKNEYNNFVIADTVVGRLLLGKQLYITSETNEFYIGNINATTKNADANGSTFGVQIKENDAERIFLGIEKDLDGIRRAKLRLTSKDGLRTVLTDEGILQNIQMCGHDELDNSTPMKISVFVNNGTNRIDEAIFRLRCENFRCPVKSISSGGSATTTNNGGAWADTIGTTTATGLDYLVMSTTIPIPTTNPGHPNPEDPLHMTHYHQASRADIFSHSHNFSIGINIPSHFHYFDFTHNHDLITGIFNDSLASNLIILVNGTQIATGVNGDYEISIKDNLIIGQWNEITVQSFSKGRVSWNYWQKSFDSF